MQEFPTFPVPHLRAPVLLPRHLPCVPVPTPHVTVHSAHHTLLTTLKVTAVLLPPHQTVSSLRGLISVG